MKYEPNGEPTTFITDVLRNVNSKGTGGPGVGVDGANRSDGRSGVGGDERETILEVFPGQLEWGTMDGIEHAFFPSWKCRFGDQEDNRFVGLNGFGWGSILPDRNVDELLAVDKVQRR